MKLSVSCIMCKYFLSSCRLSFHFVYGLTCCANLVRFIRSHLFVFISVALGDWPTVWFISENVLPMISFRSFMVLDLMFKPLSHLEFLCVCMVGGCVLTSLVYIQQSNFSTSIWWIACLFPIVYFSRWRLIDQRCVFISGLSVLYHQSICLFLCQYNVFLITVALSYCLKSGTVMSIYFVFFLQDSFGNYRSFTIPHEF